MAKKTTTSNDKKTNSEVVPPTVTQAAVASQSTQSRTSQTPQTPTYEQIAARAYEIYQARGGEHGYDQQDWAQAEAELKIGRV
jgi:hypothetical protein